MPQRSFVVEHLLNPLGDLVRMQNIKRDGKKKAEDIKIILATEMGLLNALKKIRFNPKPRQKNQISISSNQTRLVDFHVEIAKKVDEVIQKNETEQRIVETRTTWTKTPQTPVFKTDLQIEENNINFDNETFEIELPTNNQILKAEPNITQNQPVFVGPITQNNPSILSVGDHSGDNVLTSLGSIKINRDKIKNTKNKTKKKNGYSKAKNNYQKVQTELERKKKELEEIERIAKEKEEELKRKEKQREKKQKQKALEKKKREKEEEIKAKQELKLKKQREKEKKKQERLKKIEERKLEKQRQKELKEKEKLEKIKAIEREKQRQKELREKQKIKEMKAKELEKQKQEELKAKQELKLKKQKKAKNKKTTKEKKPVTINFLKKKTTKKQKHIKRPEAEKKQRKPEPKITEKPVEKNIQPPEDDLVQAFEIIDDLLGKLPDDTIDKFAKSDDFEIYKKVVTRYKKK